MKKPMSAVILERILLSSIGVMILGGLFGFSVINDLLRHSARSTNHAQIDAVIGRDTIDQLRYLDSYVEKNKAIIDRTASIVADSRQYSYQNQIIADINTYAARAGVSILGYNFTTEQQKSSRIVAGLKTINATITLKSPIDYPNFMRFLKATEQNLTKMQITGISLSPDQAGGGRISNPTIGLEVYVK
jgi:hypothetical protein